MAYTVINFKTKKALKEAVASGKRITVYQPGAVGGVINDGKQFLEGPHYPEAHKWYAAVEVKNSVIIPGTIK